MAADVDGKETSFGLDKRFLGMRVSYEIVDFETAEKPSKWLFDGLGQDKIQFDLYTGRISWMKDALREMNSQYGVVRIGSKSVVVSHTYEPSLGWPKPTYYVPSELKFFHASDFAVVREGDDMESHLEKKPVFPEWLGWEHRRRYINFEFRPAVTYREGNIPPLPEGSTYNPWQGYGFKPRPGDCGLMLGHIKDVLCGGSLEKYETIINLMAAMMQFPEVTGLPLGVLQSCEEGTGKNTLIETFFQPLYGYHAIIVDKPEHITGRFNEHLAMAVFIYINEAVWGGNKQLESAYKTLFTDLYRMLEQKFKDAVQVINYIKGFLGSNEGWSAPVGLHDRRHICFDVSAARVGDLEYFGKLRRQMDLEGGKEALLDMLLKHAVDFDALRKPPAWESVTKARNTAEGLDDVDAFVYDLLDSGDPVLDTTDRLVSVNPAVFIKEIDDADFSHPFHAALERMRQDELNSNKPGNGGNVSEAYDFFPGPQDLDARLAPYITTSMWIAY